MPARKASTAVARQPSRKVLKGAIVNATDVPTREIIHAMENQYPEFAVLTRWAQNVQGRNSGIFQRDRYVTPNCIFDQFKTAADATEHDDVVSGVCEMTEAIAFSSVEIECDDEDEQDIWQQIIDDMELFARMREMWRELFTVSQYYVGILWGTKSYKVRGTTDSGNKKKKSFDNLKVPIGLSILDPMKVAPVGNFMFGQERLAYIANRVEGEAFENVLAGPNTTDLIVAQLIESRYFAPMEEARYLKDACGASNLQYLFLMNQSTVFRHTMTRPAYKRFADVRLKAIFELLDLKQQLRQMDRAHLLANTNFIVLVKKGSDTMPAKPAELENLANQVRTAARVPIIVGDHRLEIEIITPKTDETLNPERYNALDSRVTARLLQLFATGNFATGAKGDDSIKLAKLVARGMESRRKMMGESLMKNVLLPTFVRNSVFKTPPNILFNPQRITLDFDPSVLAYLQETADRGWLSRETLLGEMDIDQVDEARRKKREKKYDSLFQPPVMPIAPGAAGPPGQGGLAKAPTANATPSANPKRAGQKGGRAGGTNRNSFKSNPGRGPAAQ